MRCAVGSMVSQASSAGSGAGSVIKKLRPGVRMASSRDRSKLPGLSMLATLKIGPSSRLPSTRRW